MYPRMILPSPRMRARKALFAAGLTAGLLTCLPDMTRQDTRPALRVGPSKTEAAETPVPNRTEHFAHSARRIRLHPALGPHTPEEIKRRAAVLVEPPQLAKPPVDLAIEESTRSVVKAPAQVAASVSAFPVTRSDNRTDEIPSASSDTAEVVPVRATAADAPATHAGRRSGSRNVVIPMVVSSNDGTWRADQGDGRKGAARNAHCRAEVLDQLKRLSTASYRIYERINDKRMFTAWILCDDRQRGLTTAVHEAVHMLTEQLDAYPLIDGGQIARIASLERLARPGRIASQFKASDDFVKTYLLPGGASSADDFTYLLDEFNAYVHDLNTAVETKVMAPRDARVGHRDGLAAMMSFVMAYVAFAEKEEPRTWAGLHRPDVKHLVSTLWSEAERTMEKSCHVPRYSVDDRTFLRHICSPANGRALGHLLGRAPQCPRTCLDAEG